MKRKAIFVGLVFFCVYACSPQQGDNREEESPAAAQNQVVEPDPEYSGRLYTSGLSPEEVERLELEWPVFQVVGSENYFFSGPDTLQEYIGRCVALDANVKPNWLGSTEYINDQTTYNRSALEVNSIDPLPYAMCTEPEVPEEEQPDAGDLSAYRGKLRRMVRPAPDIAYDYALQLEEPYRDENHPEEPGKLVTELPLVVFRPDKINKLEEALADDKTVVVEADQVTGYAEATALRVAKILRPEVEKEEITTPET